MNESKRYENIRKDINAQSRAFKFFIQKYVLDDESFELLCQISKVTDVYIFSGIIRDFLIGEVDYVRDLDIVVKNPIKGMLPYKYLKLRTILRNSFGGLKIKSSKISIDAWYLKDTWGIVQREMSSNVNSLIETAFFNFSSIVYDFRDSKFIYSDHFVKFLLTRTMDVVYKDNPNIPLCLFNVFYYHHRFLFKVGDELKKWVRKHRNVCKDFSGVQRSHLGEAIFKNELINQFLESL